MVHFALIQLTKKHTEIFGTFIEIILKNKWDLTIYYNLDDDEYTFVPFYMKLFEKEITIKRTKHLINDKNNFDFLVFTSSSDFNKSTELFEDPSIKNKKIFIQHQAAQYKDYMGKNITVSPVINLEAFHKYILPIYRGYKKLHWIKQPKTIFAIIGGVRANSNGQTIDRNLNIIKNTIESNPDGNYEFWFFMRKWDWIWVTKKIPSIANNPKIKSFPGLQTEELIERLKDVKFILPLGKKGGWFYWQRLTGSIPLAINFNIPLIMDCELAQIYKLEDVCICYNNCLSEIINKVLNMEDEIYYGLIEKLVIYKKKVSKENEKNFIDLCLKQLT